jgi:hypothetical protein
MSALKCKPTRSLASNDSSSIVIISLRICAPPPIIALHLVSTLPKDPSLYLSTVTVTSCDHGVRPHVLYASYPLLTPRNLATSPLVRSGLYKCLPTLTVLYFSDQMRALMDKPTNIRNMSVIAHGTLICTLTTLII